MKKALNVACIVLASVNLALLIADIVSDVKAIKASSEQ